MQRDTVYAVVLRKSGTHKQLSWKEFYVSDNNIKGG